MIESLRDLEAVVAERSSSDPESSYTAKLLSKPGSSRRKVMEEAFEFVDESDPNRVAEEAADLFYHAVVRLHETGVPVESVFAVLDKHRSQA